MSIAWFDFDTNVKIVEAFINDLCTEELKPQVRALLEQQDWSGLEKLMAPFYNTPA